MSVFSLHIDADHRGILFQVGSWIHNGSPQVTQRRVLILGRLILISHSYRTTFPLHSGERSGQPYT